MSAWSRETMASREELLQSIQPGMKLNRAFFLKIYGYELTWPGFRETAIKALEEVGCSRAREHYNSIVSEYEKGYQEQIREVGKWYLGESQKRQKGSEEQRKKKNSLSRETVSKEILKW